MPFVINAEMGSEDGVVRELRKIDKIKKAYAESQDQVMTSSGAECVRLGIFR
jgi:hypothetical protein